MKLLRLAVSTAFWLAFTYAAKASCPTFTTLTNGTTADANSVMGNFNHILGCPSFTGNVGIGTASPNAALDVEGTSSPLVTLNRATSFGGSANISFERSRGTLAAPVALSVGDAVGGFLSEGYEGTSYLNSADFLFSVDGAVQAGVVPTAIVFRPGISTPVEAMRITSGGRVGIKTSTPTQALEVNGEVKIDSFASAGATPVCENAGVLSSCSSSLRYKIDVRAATFGLGDIMRMHPVTFKWEDRDESGFGLIAEDVAKINPLFVTYKNGRVEGVKYSQLTAVLVNAIKTLQAENEKLRTENGKIKAVIDKHDAEIVALRALQERTNARLDLITAQIGLRSSEANISKAMKP